MNSDRPLRILIVISHAWDERLGAPRVYMELAEQWRAAGNTVEKFSLSDAFPDGAGAGAKFLLRQFRFAYMASAFIRKNADRFDVVDALAGDLPFTKKKLRFRGLLVARSVGLPRFYDQFEKSIARSSFRPRRGSLAGRVFYGWARWRRLKASEKALRNADLVNVPNAAEAGEIAKRRSPRSIIVQPYGLTDERRAQLRAAAAPAEARLAAKKVCFIGMWGPRKGAYDWPRLIDLVRARAADASFVFLGTMVEPAQIKAALGRQADAVEVVPEYRPDELPQLLAGCTVGAFPSYVEGFGLAVLEQSAAGIPTVAFDIPGPRDILAGDLDPLLVGRGDLDAFAGAVVEVLQANVARYRRLAEQSAETAAKYSWPLIAGATVDAYRAALTELSGPSLIFAQPFALASPGGGARILRALLEEPPVPVALISTAPEPPQLRDPLHETHVPRRPAFGRIEQSRWHRLPELITSWFRRAFRRRLEKVCQERRALGIHAIPHGGLDFYDSYIVASKLAVPYFLQIHDDLIYSGKGLVDLAAAAGALKEVWNKAQARFVISPQMGAEYARRYGPQEFTVITDGIEKIAPAPMVARADDLRMYFMGLFHIGYEANLRVLLRALALTEASRPALRVSLTLRCGQLSARDLASDRRVRVLPFGSEADVAHDLENATLLYLPLPFGAKFEPFVRLSLSTKLVTYLGSGIPILYHGPPAAAVGELLSNHDAGFCEHSLDPETMAELLTRECLEPSQRTRKAANALALARTNFMLEDQRQKFWNAITPFLPSAPRGARPHSLVSAR